MSDSKTVEDFVGLVGCLMTMALNHGQPLDWKVKPDGRGGATITLTIDPLLPAFVPGGGTTDFGDHP